MVSPVLPSSCRSVPGRGSALVIAPHGGLCARDLLASDPAVGLRGNDLHTGELARLLAARLDASLLANVAVDRNDVDLNRIDEVVTRAPWFLDALGEHLERIVARHGRALVLIVHGWQIVQPRCDVGIGARLAAAGDALACAERLTVSPDFVAGPLEELRAATAAQGVETTYGIRWPAQHRNNVMQLFRRVAPDAASSRTQHPVALHGCSGRVEAVQLELGAPLRYPGKWRERFLGAVSHAFAAWTAGHAPQGRVSAGDALPERLSRPVRRANASLPPPHRPVLPQGVALQACDGADGLGVVVGLGPMSPRELGARLLLFPGGQRMLLFTGHERIGTGANDRVGGLEARPFPGGLEVRFRGPVLEVPDASRHFREEGAQLEARVVELALDLRFVAHGASAYGAVHGEARAGASAWRIDAHGFTAPVLARPPTELGSLRLTASFGSTLGVVAEVGLPHAARLRLLTPNAVREHVVATGGDVPAIVPGRLAGAFELCADDGPVLRCTPLGHVTILRPGRDGRPRHVTFGAARFELDGGARGSGFYEHGAPAVPAGRAEEGESGDGGDRSAQ